MSEQTSRREFLSESKRVSAGLAAGALLGTSTQATRAAGANAMLKRAHRKPWEARKDV